MGQSYGQYMEQVGIINEGAFMGEAADDAREDYERAYLDHQTGDCQGICYWCKMGSWATIPDAIPQLRTKVVRSFEQTKRRNLSRLQRDMRYEK